MPDDLWTQLLRDLPTTAVLLIVVVAASKYLDRWLSRFAAQSEASAEKRQAQIMILLEKLGAAQTAAERSLSDVVDRNTKALDKVGDMLVKSSETLASLVQADILQAQQMRDLTATMIEHYKDVASRPCQMGVPTRKRPPTPRAGETL